MRFDSTVTLVGNTTNPPELRFTQSGQAVAGFSIVINNSRKTDDGWEELDPTFVDVTCWGALAEHAAESIEKGQRVWVLGHLHTEIWTPDDGPERRSLRLTADDCGHSLLWHTATATKAEKSQGGGQAQQPARSNGNNNRQSQGRSNNGGRTATRTRQTERNEEPFVMDAFDGEDYFAPGAAKWSN